MDVTVRKIGNVSILDLKGALKIGEGEQKFRDQVKTLVDSGEKNFAINLAGVPMLDSSGIGTFVRTHKMLKEVGGRFTLFAPTKLVRQTLKMVGLDRFFDSTRTRPAPWQAESSPIPAPRCADKRPLLPTKGSSGKFFAQGDEILARATLVLDACHDLTNQENTQSALLPFHQGDGEIGGRVLGGIKFDSIVFNARHKLLMAHFDLQGELVLSALREGISDHIGHNFIQGQIQVEFGLGRDAMPRAKVRNEGQHSFQFRGIILEYQRGLFNHHFPNKLPRLLGGPLRLGALA